MAESDEMLGGKSTAELVIDAQRVFAADLFADDHDRTLATRPFPRGAEERVYHHDPIDSLVEVCCSSDEVAPTTRRTKCADQ